MNQSFIEVLPPLGDRADISYVEFVKSLRCHIMDDTENYAEGLEKAIERSRSEGSGSLRAFADQKPLLDAMPAVKLHNRLMRSQQEMKGHRIYRAMEANRDTLEQELAEFAERGPARLELQDGFATPGYANVEFHIQQGGYQGDALSGFGYHYGTRVFFRGDDDEDQLHAMLAAKAPQPADGTVDRVLDLACSLGQSTTALKARFPRARVWGIDQSEPMLRCAHRRAVLMNTEVTFSQRLAEDTGFPAEHFDLVYAFILFHELPPRIIDQTVDEIARVLRPGGVFAAFDFMRMHDMDIARRYHRWFDARHNGEPYSEDFCAMDFDARLKQAGLTVEQSSPSGDMHFWVARKPAA